MKLPTLDGWLSWSFDDIAYSQRTDKNSVYKFQIKKRLTLPVGSYYEEIYNNARHMRDYYSGTFDVLLSGGIDSEVVVRTFKDLGIKHNTFIFKYENNYNYRDVDSAVEIATSLGIDYKIIDFPLQKFYENDAYDLFKKSKCIRSARLTHLKFFDYLDNIPVMGDAEPYWKRVLGADYSKKSEWLIPLGENNHNSSIYCHNLGRENVCDWYEFSPNLIASFNNLPIVQDLINDKINGKQSSWTSRIPIHKILWPDIKPKHKLVGYEIDKPPGTYPEFVTNLQEIMTSEIGVGNEYWFTQSQLNDLL